MKRIFNTTFMMLVTLAFFASLGSCTDNLILSDNKVIGEGKATVTMDFSFEPQGSALNTRGIPGDLDWGINNLVILFYDENANENTGSPIYAFEYNSPTEFDIYKEEGPREQDHCEEYTYHGVVTLEDIDYGKYRIYAVANVKTLLGDYRSQQNNKVSYKISEKELREIQISWPDAPTNEATDKKTSTYNIPNAMFGYFTAGVSDHTQKKYRDVIHHNMELYKYNREGESEGNITHDDVKENRAKVVTLDKKNLQIQAWLKRVVSKLTIGFDGSDLNPGVEIYIKSVRIVDAASSCLLGHDNSVGDIYNNQPIALLQNEDYQNDPRQYTKYSDQDGAEGIKITRKTPAFPRECFDDDETNTEETKDGKTVWNETWYNYVHGKDRSFEGTYNGKNISLYFFENLQGITADNAKGYKRDYANNTEQYNKDGKPNGTYVEVEAYYNTNDDYFKNPSKGKITYRFMLGKNIANDFNVERNFHYKLILSFIGDANNIDWHIEYEEDTYFPIPSDEPGAQYSWNDSWVWHAYNDEGEPIAEICKEMVYYGNPKVYYQVVTVYPVKKNSTRDDNDKYKYTVDLNKGQIAQVLQRDTEGNIELKAGATISMCLRTQPNYKMNGTASKDASNAIVELVNGEKSQNYKYVEVLSKDYEKEVIGRTMVAIENGQAVFEYGEVSDNNKKEYDFKLGEANGTQWRIKPYRVKDGNDNEYSVVKVGASYWLRENLKATKYMSGEDIPSQDYKIYTKTNGDKLIMYGYSAVAKAKNSNEEPHYYSLTESGYYSSLKVLAQHGFVSDNYYNTNFSSFDTSEPYEINPDCSNLQLAPDGWHIPDTEPDSYYPFYKYGNLRNDNAYLEDYMKYGWERAMGEDENINWTWPNVPRSSITKRNLSGLSLLAIPANWENQNAKITYPDPMDILFSSSPNLNDKVFPFWTGEAYYENGVNYPHTTVFCYDSWDNLLVNLTLWQGENWCKAISTAYLPIRCARNAYDYSVEKIEPKR